jgi:HK97 family phage prohead protease
MKTKEKMFFKNIQIRSKETEDKRIIEGVIPYNSRSVPMWGGVEILDPAVFRKTLSDKKNIFALYAHDDNKVLGSTRAETLILENDEDGLTCRCILPNTSYANDAWELIRRGDVQTMSFGFRPIKWQDNSSERILKEVSLEEVSFCVPFPAYQETSSKILRGFKRMEINIDKINEILEKENLNEDDIATLQDFVKSINEVIEKNVSGKTETETEPQEPQEQKAAREEKPHDSTSETTSTSGDSNSEKEKENEEKEKIKQEILDLINLLFETEKNIDNDDDEENTEE